MSQSFRTPPRQIAFKSQRRLSPVGSPSPAQSHEDPRIKQHVIQLQQMSGRLRLMQERLVKAIIPASRQNLEQQILALKQQMKTHQRALMELRGTARILLLQPLSVALKSPEQTLHDLFRKHLAEIDAIYRVYQPLPRGLMPRLELWLQTLRKLFDILDPKKFEQVPDQLAETQTCLGELSGRLWPKETEVINQFWSSWDLLIRSELSESKADSEPDSNVNQLSFAVPDETLQAENSAYSDLESQGELQVSFDFSAGKSVLRNQMGITLNQNKKNYEEYLEAGFQAIDHTVSNHFENLDPLYQAVADFLEAVSQDKSRYEAYFGLGYLYSLVQDINHALYFLDVAWKISGDQAIWEMIEKVRHNAGIRDTVAI